ncbi:MAG: hypothetical protein QXG00_04060 [Candidatus Woesearchaeota archaeon]
MVKNNIGKRYFKHLVKNQKSLVKKKFNNDLIKMLLVRYKLKKEIRVRNEIIELCYPIIFKVINNTLNMLKYSNKNKVFDNQDLFNECILVTINCIENYNFKNETKTRFITYLWLSLQRKIIKFVNKNVFDYSKNKIELNFEDNINDLDEELIYNFKEDKINNNGNDWLVSYNQELEKDFIKLLNNDEKKVYKFKKFKLPIKDLKKTIKMNNNQYYKILNGIKEKLERYIYERKND